MNDPIHPHHFNPQNLSNPHLFSTSTATPTLVSQHGLEPIDFSSFDTVLDGHSDLSNPFDTSPPPLDPRNTPRFHEIRSTGSVNNFQSQRDAQAHQFTVSPRVPSRPRNEPPDSAGQFGILTPQVPSQPARSHAETLGSLQNEIDLRAKPVAEGGTTDGHFSNLKLIPNPPDLEEWRKKLFEVSEPITMTEDEFQTYFPHVDNIYSHRSTQRYKRKPFVSHYWDCRLKGRPPGTAKSEDPDKKKRKRSVRERDLCDVKIKITEFSPGAKGPDQKDVTGSNPFREITPATGEQHLPPTPITPVLASNGGSQAHPGPHKADGRYYTIQRVNGNGANGKDMATSGGHRHSIEESDKVKKNSIHRYFLKEEREKRKTQKTYHKKATGNALITVKKHAKDHDLKLYGSCFCPFVQRVWISLELKGLSYQYIEIDPYKKPDQLLAINPRGLIPALQHGEWGCYESSVLMEYLEDLSTGIPLLPIGNPRSRAYCRLWSDHINRKITPQFYRLLQAQETEKQTQHAEELRNELSTLIDASDPVGPFFLGPHISFVDVQFAPWILRFRRVLRPYRAWPELESGTRWAKWVEAIETNESVKATTSTDDLYLDSYERYAENRPNTSQVAQAVNEGMGLP